MGPKFSELTLSEKVNAIYHGLEARVPGIVAYFEEQAEAISGQPNDDEQPAGPSAPQPNASAPAGTPVDDSQVPHEQTVSVQAAPEDDGSQPKGEDAVTLSVDDAEAFRKWKASQQEPSKPTPSLPF